MTVTSVQSVSARAFSVTFTATQVPERPRAESTADRLLTALDADGDGAVTRDEFTTGAQSLLRQAGARRRAEGPDDRGRHETRGLRRLERKLERVFDRVDANDDGAVDADELTTALSGARPGSRGHGSAAGSSPAAEAPPAPGGATTVSVQVTFVALAIQRYTATESALPTEQPAPSLHPLPPIHADVPPVATSPSEPEHHV